MPKGIYERKKGIKFTEEHRARMSASLKGRKVSEETRKKMSLSLKGRKLSLETRNKMSASHSGKNHFMFGKHPSLESRRKMSVSHMGNHNRRGKFSSYIPWNKGLGKTHQNKLDRIRFHDSMQKLVFERDNYTCQICGARGVSLQVDHIQPWAEYVEGRFDMNNCRTLCISCHYFITWGRPKPEYVNTWGHNLKLVNKG